MVARLNILLDEPFYNKCKRSLKATMYPDGSMCNKCLISKMSCNQPAGVTLSCKFSVNLASHQFRDATSADNDLCD